MGDHVVPSPPPQRVDTGQDLEREMSLEFPVLPGDRHVIAVQSSYRFDHGYDGPNLPATEGVIQVLWLPHHEQPTIFIH